MNNSTAQMQAAFSGPPGWRMIDRFYGFRYELEGKDLFDSDLEEAIIKKADEMGCFGWIQRSDKGTYVGEVRCAKTRGPIFQEWLNNYNNIVSAMHTKIYEDTKIRLHFSSFTILPEDRDTCFLDHPHKCADVNLEEETKERIMKGMNPGSTLDNFEL